LDFDIPIGHNGDCYDRYLVRVEEMRQSIKIINQCINKIPEGIIKNINNKITLVNRNLMKNSMEGLIHHFKYYSNGIILPSKEVYTAVEAPKGEFGVFFSVR